MRVKALRGVCIGVDRHMKADDITDLDTATVTFLVSIGAVERLTDDTEQKPMESPAPLTRKELGKKEK